MHGVGNYLGLGCLKNIVYPLYQITITERIIQSCGLISPHFNLWASVRLGVFLYIIHLWGINRLDLRGIFYEERFIFSSHWRRLILDKWESNYFQPIILSFYFHQRMKRNQGYVQKIQDYARWSVGRPDLTCATLMSTAQVSWSAVVCEQNRSWAHWSLFDVLI